MLHFLLILALFSPCLAAPTCEPNAFCYQPKDGIKITVTRNGDFLDVKMVGGAKFNVVLRQTNNGKELTFACLERNDNTCHAQYKINEFEAGSPITLKLEGSSEASEPFQIDSLTPPPQEGLTKQQRRQFSKAHAILMILGWLFFVPTGFLFARLGKDLFKEQTIFGTAVWFQIHRASNFMGVVCICASMLCIFISQQWTWKGTGSGSKYWTEVHTDLGVISTVLAVAQPINSLFRCGPTHSHRIIFNWAHRIVGIVAYTLALTAIVIAAITFKKIWNEPLLEMVLVLLPIVICLVASVVFTVFESDRFRRKASYGEMRVRNRLVKIRRSPKSKDPAEENDANPLLSEDSDAFDENSKPLADKTPHILKAPVIFWAIGVFFCIAVALSLLVVNGYKN